MEWRIPELQSLALQESYTWHATMLEPLDSLCWIATAPLRAVQWAFRLYVGLTVLGVIASTELALCITCKLEAVFYWPFHRSVSSAKTLEAAACPQRLKAATRAFWHVLGGSSLPDQGRSSHFAVGSESSSLAFRNARQDSPAQGRPSLCRGFTPLPWRSSLSAWPENTWCEPVRCRQT